MASFCRIVVALLVTCCSLLPVTRLYSYFFLKTLLLLLTRCPSFHLPRLDWIGYGILTGLQGNNVGQKRGNMGEGDGGTEVELL